MKKDKTRMRDVGEEEEFERRKVQYPLFTDCMHIPRESLQALARDHKKKPGRTGGKREKEASKESQGVDYHHAKRAPVTYTGRDLLPSLLTNAGKKKKKKITAARPAREGGTTGRTCRSASASNIYVSRPSPEGSSVEAESAHSSKKNRTPRGGKREREGGREEKRRSLQSASPAGGEKTKVSP